MIKPLVQTSNYHKSLKEEYLRLTFAESHACQALPAILLLYGCKLVMIKSINPKAAVAAIGVSTFNIDASYMLALLNESILNIATVMAEDLSLFPFVAMG